MDTLLKFDRQGLIPVVVQDQESGDVLMVAFMNEEALQKTRQTGYTHFFSRTRNAIWRKGEQSGHSQQVREILLNCEENSLLIKVMQPGGATCHKGYHSCYYRRLQPDGSAEVIAERLFDPDTVYSTAPLAAIPDLFASSEQNGEAKREEAGTLETSLRQLYGAYLYLRDHDLSEESNTSRLLQDHDPQYLLARLADELQELASVQSGEHIHEGRAFDTIFEGSQVGYWLMLLASSGTLAYDDFTPHTALLEGYHTPSSNDRAVEVEQECLSHLASNEREAIVQGLRAGFSLIGCGCARAEISPLAPAEFDLEQMRRKGLVK